jgi:hypothetical protein
MQQYAAALSDMDLSSFEPLVDSEAPDKACQIAQMAAASRRLPIQDAPDFWEPQEMHRRSAVQMGPVR